MCSNFVQSHNYFLLFKAYCNIHSLHPQPLLTSQPNSHGWSIIHSSDQTQFHTLQSSTSHSLFNHQPSSISKPHQWSHHTPPHQSNIVIQGITPQCRFNSTLILHSYIMIPSIIYFHYHFQLLYNHTKFLMLYFKSFLASTDPWTYLQLFPISSHVLYFTKGHGQGHEPIIPGPDKVGHIAWCIPAVNLMHVVISSYIHQLTTNYYLSNTETHQP